MFFQPNKDSPLVTAVMQALMPVIRRVGLGGLRVELDETSRRRLASHQGAGLLASNHPTRIDPAVLFEVSRQVHRRFNYISAYEAFIEMGPVMRWLLPRVGVYSVVRGTVDRESFRNTRRLLAEQERMVVIFPEGTAPYQNDTLVDFQPGPVQMAFWAMDDREKAGLPPGPMPVYPCTIKYVFRGPVLPRLERLLSRLEIAVLGRAGQGPLYPRLLPLGEGLLTTLERDSGLTAPPGQALTERVDALREHLLRRAERAAGITPLANAAFLDRVFAIRRAADRDLLEAAGSETTTDYQALLRREARQRLAFLVREQDRLTIFASFHDGYVRDWPSPERIGEILDRLHREVTGGRRAHLPPRTALVRVGEPIDVSQWAGGGRAARKEAVIEVTTRLHQEIATTLDALYRTRTAPIELPPQPGEPS